MTNILFHLRPLIRDISGELLYQIGLTRPSFRASHHFTIVTFHRVLPRDQLNSYPLGELAVTPEEFSWFIDFFSEHFTCGSLVEVVSRWQKGGKIKHPLLALTFDDGQLDNFFYAKPVLDKAGIHASFFVVIDNLENENMLWHNRIAYLASRFLEQNPKMAYEFLNKFRISTTGASYELVKNTIEYAKTLTPHERFIWMEEMDKIVGDLHYPHWEGMMNWHHLQELIKDGHEVGSHSMSHAILPFCNDQQLIYEVNHSRQLLQEGIGHSVDSFCYPNGDYDERTLKAVQEAGYRQAVTTRHGVNSTETPSHFTLRRCDIQSQHGYSRKGNLSITRLAWRLSRFHPEGLH